MSREIIVRRSDSEDVICTIATDEPTEIDLEAGSYRFIPSFPAAEQLARSLKLPHIWMDEATVAEVAYFLHHKSIENDEGSPLNIVLSSQDFAEEEVSFELRGVSFHDALETTAGIAGLSLQYDETKATLRR